MSSVFIRNLSITYLSKGEQINALSDISLSINEGEIYSIMGPSGSGKSTLLHALSGIINEYKGEILIDGKKPDPQTQSIGLVPQSYGLLPWKNVKENIFLPAKIKKIEVDEKENSEILRTLDLQELLHRYPHELSGGQKQRVALARAFIQKPDLLLMDEPFSALDTITAEKCRNLFLKVWKRHKVTTLFITHSIDEAVIMGKHLIFMSKSPGNILHIIENPLLVSNADRSPKAYFEFAQQLREQINKEWI